MNNKINNWLTDMAKHTKVANDTLDYIHELEKDDETLLNRTLRDNERMRSVIFKLRTEVMDIKSK